MTSQYLYVQYSCCVKLFMEFTSLHSLTSLTQVFDHLPSIQPTSASTSPVARRFHKRHRPSLPPTSPVARRFHQRHPSPVAFTNVTRRPSLPPSSSVARRFHQRHRPSLPPTSSVARRFHQRHRPSIQPMSPRTNSVAILLFSQCRGLFFHLRLCLHVCFIGKIPAMFQHV